MSENVAACEAYVYTGSPWSPRKRCARAIKADGLCAVHLAAKRRRDANDEARRRDMEAREARWAADLSMSGVLTRRAGCVVKVSGASVTMSSDDFMRLLREAGR